MHEREEAVEKLEREYSRDMSGLWELLENELDGAYDGDLPTNQNDNFLRTCFMSIAPEDTPRECLKRQFDDYSVEWEADVGEQHFLATALKCLLFERVGRAKHNTIGQPTVLYLAQLVVALQTADEGAIYTAESNLGLAPILDSRPVHPFDPGFSFDRIETPALEEWVHSQRSETDGDHAVYVIDCTPKVGKNEDTRIRELRAEVEMQGFSSKPREKAAEAVNNGECAYYVGYCKNVPKRMRQHAEGMTDGGAKFLSLFTPVELVNLTWHETEKKARKFEKRKAGELTEPGGSYAFCETNR